MRIVCGAAPSSHLDTDCIDCVDQLSSVWGHSSLHELRSYCVCKAVRGVCQGCVDHCAGQRKV